MNKILEIIMCVFLVCAFTFFIIRLTALVVQTKGVTPILKVYNDAIVQCKDDACRQYVNVFYVRALRELTGEPSNAN